MWLLVGYQFTALDGRVSKLANLSISINYVITRREMDINCGNGRIINE